MEKGIAIEQRVAHLATLPRGAGGPKVVEAAFFSALLGAQILQR
jgi:hypothetical protein